MGTRRRLLGGLAAGLAGSVAARSALAQLRVDITKGRIEPTPIAVSPFAGDSAADRDLGERIAAVIAADLDGSGLFRTIDRGAYIQKAEELRELPRFADWRQINAQALVTGVVRGNGAGASVVEFRLWDVFAASQLTGVRFEGPAALWRRLAHKTADAVYERLTGEKGYFDTKIAYVAELGDAKNRTKRLAVMDQDGANHAFLTDGRFAAITPRFSPDTARLAYAAWRDGGLRVYVRELASGRETAIREPDGLLFSPRWAPDGRSLLVTAASEGNSDIYAVDLATQRASRLTDGSAIDTSPSFAPDGRRIAFNSDRAGGPQLYVMGAGGGGGQRISFGAGRYGDPAWSPRGDLLTFTRLAQGSIFIGVMRPDGSDERALTKSPADRSPGWSPNGRVIVFGRGGARRRLFTIDLTGYNERELPTPLDASDPDWSALLP